MREIGKSVESPAVQTHAQGEDWLDRGAFLASAICLMHCLLLPVLLAALPALSIASMVSDSFHRLLLLLIVPTSGFALYLAWVRRRNVAAVVLGAVGIACLAVASLLLAGVWETGVTVCGSLLLATAHTINWRSRRGNCG